MARRKRGHTGDSHLLERVLNPPIASRRLLPEPVRASDYPAIEDRRSYHPLDQFRPVMNTIGGRAGPVTVAKPLKNKSRAMLAHGLAFSAPKNTLICVRRNQRKEVLHALKKTGRGKGGGRKRFTPYSKIGC